MSRVKVKFRKSTVPGKTGTVYYQICRKGKSLQFTTRIHLLADEWDDSSGNVKRSDRNSAELQMYQNQIDSDTKFIQDIMDGFRNSGNDSWTVSDVEARFRNCSSGMTVLKFIDSLICQMKAKGKLGTARNYQKARNSMSNFLQGKDIAFFLMNDRFISCYNEWLTSRKMVKNSISFYMRIWRAVYNKAVRLKLTSQEFPFSDVYTGIDHTRKRAVEESTLTRLQQLDLIGNQPLELSRDLFMFSYFTRGMAFIDIAFLKKRDIDGKTISYSRQKTGQRMSIHLEPCMSQIINRYRNATASSPYVFPMITATDPETAFRQYQTALGYHNRKLKRLSMMIHSQTPLTSYTARHSWATSARNHNVPVTIISAGMGHTTENTTRIYLAAMDGSIIDRANHDLLKEFNRRMVSLQETSQINSQRY